MDNNALIRRLVQARNEAAYNLEAIELELQSALTDCNLDLLTFKGRDAKGLGRSTTLLVRRDASLPRQAFKVQSITPWHAGKTEEITFYQT
jgi:hypothetical protein